jgi:hypothetical protein
VGLTEAPTSRLGRAGDALALELLFADGLGVRSDGAYVRWCELDPVNPWVLDGHERDRLSTALTGVAQRVPEGQTVTFVAEARPAPVREMCHEGRLRALEALRHARPGADNGYAMARLQHLFEENLLELASRHAALEYRYLLAIAYRPPGPLLRRRSSTLTQRAHDRHVGRLDQLAESIRRALSALHIGTRLWVGSEVAEALWQAWNPTSADASALALGQLEERLVAGEAPSSASVGRHAARLLRDTLAASGYRDAGATLDVEQDRHLTLAVDRRPTTQVSAGCSRRRRPACRFVWSSISRHVRRPRCVERSARSTRWPARPAVPPPAPARSRTSTTARSKPRSTGSTSA